ncbi:MAG: hypothetical protein SXV54_07250 [Chloroflexota bacterium]|nr:hypothetical protein [Chloroflexota bacterium]
MKISLIDVVEWQTMVDFRTGRSVAVNHPLADLAAEVLRAHPYPGDLTGAGDHWVTDTALDLNARYAPDFMLLVYANLYFPAVFSPLSEEERADQIARTFRQVECFLEGSGFAPVIVGLGDFVPFQRYVYLTDLDSEVVSGGMNPRYAGLNRATAQDLNRLAKREGIALIVGQDEFRAQFGGCQQFYDRFPDHLIVAEEGHIFRGPSSSARPLYRVSRYDQALPLYTTLGTAEIITDVAELTLRALERERVALILVEGVGCECFPLPFKPISNRLHWHTYSVGDSQYLALTTGKHFVEHPYPPGYRYYVDDGEDKEYPFSAVFTEMPPDTIGARFAGRSAAVGGRGILTHAVAGVDIAVECFVRALYNHGVMAVLDV